MENIGLAIARVVAFIFACRTSGWSRDGRVGYANHIITAGRYAGMSDAERYEFARRWAIDCGGTGPV